MNKQFRIGKAYSLIGALIVCLLSINLEIYNVPLLIVYIIGFIMLAYGLIMLIVGTVDALKDKNQK